MLGRLAPARGAAALSSAEEAPSPPLISKQENSKRNELEKNGRERENACRPEDPADGAEHRSVWPLRAKSRGEL
jgi:hypothetical protein